MPESHHYWSKITFADLTEPQVAFIKKVLANPEQSQLLRGCAGSGKTVIAAHALSLLRKHANKTVGFLVYTKLLRKFIEDGFEGDGIAEDIFHFHDWYHRRKRPPKDIFLIDEGQDFEPGWIESVRAASKVQIWLGNASQQIYEDALNGKGFETLAASFANGQVTELGTNHRNSICVAKFASKFLQLNGFDRKNGITLETKRANFVNPIFKNSVQTSGANNQPVVFIEANSTESEFDAVARVIKDILSRAAEESRRIAVVHFRNVMVDRIARELNTRNVNCMRVDVSTQTGLPDFSLQQLVIATTIHSLKGLEVDYVIFPRTEEDKWIHPEIFNNLLFVLFTRARKRVYCSYVNRASSYLFQAVANDKDTSFYQFISADELVRTGNPLKSESEIEAAIKKHFDEFNL